MNFLDLCITLAMMFSPGGAQSDIRVVFKADDMGAAHAINAGTIEAYRNGVVTSTDVIVPGPWFLDAVKLLKENPGLDVGVHLCLTSEWEGVKWRPLTSGKSFVDRDGHFFPMVWPNRNFPPGSFLLEAKLDLAEVEAELRAQIETAKRHIPRVSFLSSHMGAARATPELRAITEKLSREYSLPVQDAQTAAQWMRGVYAGTDPGPVKARKLASALQKLGPGTYIHLDHAAFDTPEMRAIGHEGYRNVAQDRWANVQAWTSGVVKEVMKRRGMKRIAVKDLFAAAGRIKLDKALLEASGAYQKNANGERLEEVRRLLLNGADPNARDKDGTRPLLSAAAKGYTGTATLLLRAGAKVNVADDRGVSPLIYASSRGNTELCRELVRRGADVEHRDKQGKTAADYARKNSHNRLFDMLRSKLP